MFSLLFTPNPPRIDYSYIQSVISPPVGPESWTALRSFSRARGTPTLVEVGRRSNTANIATDLGLILFPVILFSR